MSIDSVNNCLRGASFNAFSTELSVGLAEKIRKINKRTAETFAEAKNLREAILMLTRKERNLSFEVTPIIGMCNVSGFQGSLARRKGPFSNTELSQMSVSELLEQPECPSFVEVEESFEEKEDSDLDQISVKRLTRIMAVANEVLEERNREIAGLKEQLVHRLLEFRETERWKKTCEEAWESICPARPVDVEPKEALECKSQENPLESTSPSSESIFSRIASKVKSFFFIKKILSVFLWMQQCLVRRWT